ncbi:MAG: PIN domain-containing protein [Sphingomonadaceae bacterium]|nr:PIN domain-containing protein [Sphingomonadaceae bacterium]
MSVVVLDASALLALLKRETGANVVEALLDQAVIGSVNLGEAAQIQYLHGWGRKEFETAIAMIEISVVPISQKVAMDAADFREVARQNGISQADCLCLALAQSEGALALTADRDWLKISDQIGVEIRLIR